MSEPRPQMSREAPMTVEGQAEQMIEWLIDQGARSIPTQRATTYLTAALTRAVAQTWQTAAEDVILSVEDSDSTQVKIRCVELAKAFRARSGQEG